MSSRKRRDGETFEEYRKSLKEEAAALKGYLKGEFVHVSCLIVKHPKTGRLVKVRSMGTYTKPGVVI